MSDRHFAICPRGLEAALDDELRALGAEDIRPMGGGASFVADQATAYRVNLHTRIAGRILREVGQARYRNDDDVYKLAARTPWERWMSAEQRLRVDVKAARSRARSLNFLTLRIKDGIVDRLRQQTGARPSIDTRRPDVRVYGFLDERQVTLYLDLSGEPLFKRGWRDEDLADEDAEGAAKGEAPLKENLAAGLLALCGWRPGIPLHDPFCGSGTILIEAAWQARGFASGRGRRFAFEQLLDFDAAAWARVRTEADTAEHRDPPETPGLLVGGDISGQALVRARANAVRAGVPEGDIEWRQVEALGASPAARDGSTGMVIGNPPYGERMSWRGGSGTAGDPVRAFGDRLKSHFPGWRVGLLSTDPGLPRALGMRERRRIPIFNGPLECRLFIFDIFGEAPVPRSGPARSEDADTTPG